MDTRGARGHRQFCLPNLPTYGYHVLQRFTKETFGSFPFSSWRIDCEQRVPDSSNDSPYLIRLFSFSNLEGNFGPDGSISLSPSPPPLPPPPLPTPPPQPPPRPPQQHTTHRDRDTETETETQTQRQTQRRRQNPNITNDLHVRHFP